MGVPWLLLADPKQSGESHAGFGLGGYCVPFLHRQGAHLEAVGSGRGADSVSLPPLPRAPLLVTWSECCVLWCPGLAFLRLNVSELLRGG